MGYSSPTALRPTPAFPVGHRFSIPRSTLALVMPLGHLFSVPRSMRVFASPARRFLLDANEEHDKGERKRGTDGGVGRSPITGKRVVEPVSR